MRCEERGPDLLARALTPHDAPASGAASELETHVADCGACRDELARLERDVRAATASRPAAPPKALRARILAAIRDEAADRRADAAVLAARSCPDVREDIPLHVLGHIDGAARERLDAHLAACGACADERRVAEKLVTAHRNAVRPAPPEALRAQVLAAIRIQHLGDAPPPAAPLRLLEARKARNRARRLSMLVPFVAAASLFAAISLTAPAVGLHVQDDAGALYLPANPALVPTQWLDRSAGEVRLAPGDGVGAGERPVDVRLRFGGRRAADPSADEPNAGEIRLRLQPGTRLVRVDDESFDLRMGRVAVHAGKLDVRLTIRHGDAYAAVVGTRFEAAVVGDRLVVSVAEGRVEVGRCGASPRSEILGAGQEALVDATRLLTRRTDGTPAADAFLAPRVVLAARSASLGPGAALVLDAELAAGEGGPVTVKPLDDSDPRFLVRLKGPGGRTFDTKVQRSMLAEPSARDAASGPSVRLDETRPYRLRLRLDGLTLEPGRWEATVRYQNYGARDDGSEWHGSVESDPVSFEVTSE